MYPQRELTALARRKALLCARIARRRVGIAENLAAAARPVAWIDRLYAQWQALPAGVRAGAPWLLMLLLRRRRRRQGGRAGTLKTLLRWAPLGWRAWQGMRMARPWTNVF